MIIIAALFKNASLVMTTLRIYFTIDRSGMEGKVAAVAVNFLLLRHIVVSSVGSDVLQK